MYGVACKLAVRSAAVAKNAKISIELRSAVGNTMIRPKRLL